ncbi:hypothetical protein BGX27_008955 [Mortierella sp. AM989]|nr:hypothetical protein BGX27_008955 [Mortierella sp. AM989]
MANSEDMDIDSVSLVKSRTRYISKARMTASSMTASSSPSTNPTDTDSSSVSSSKQPRRTNPMSTSRSSTPTVATASFTTAPKGKMSHVRTILEASLPEGSVVSNEALDRVSHAFQTLIDEASEAAARKALSKSTSRPASRRAPSSRSSVSQRATPAIGVKSPATIKKPATTRTTVSKSKKSGKKGNISGSKKQKEAAESEDNVYEVESILAHKVNRAGKYQFRIKWKGFPLSKATWEEKECLDGCQDLLKDYAKKEKLSL